MSLLFVCCLTRMTLLVASICPPTLKTDLTDFQLCILVIIMDKTISKMCVMTLASVQWK